MRYFIFIFTVFTLLHACKEEPPSVNFEPDYVTYETTYVTISPFPQIREVLIEDISGVRCVNCPDAANDIKNIKAANPGRVNSVTIHPKGVLDGLTLPYNFPSQGYVSKYDLRTDVGAQIANTFGIPNTLPIGYVNRKLYPGYTVRYQAREIWAEKVTSEKDSITPVNIELSTTYSTDGKLNTDVKLTFTQYLSGEYYINLMLAENSIIDLQETKTGIDKHYEHEHILRTMLTANLGDRINTAVSGFLAPGRVIIKRYRILPDAAWNKKQMEIIAFVHRGNDNVVVQSKRFDVPE